MTLTCPCGFRHRGRSMDQPHARVFIDAGRGGKVVHWVRLGRQRADGSWNWNSSSPACGHGHRHSDQRHGAAANARRRTAGVRRFVIRARHADPPRPRRLLRGTRPERKTKTESRSAACAPAGAMRRANPVAPWATMFARGLARRELVIGELVQELIVSSASVYSPRAVARLCPDSDWRVHPSVRRFERTAAARVLTKLSRNSRSASGVGTAAQRGTGRLGTSL